METSGIRLETLSAGLLQRSFPPVYGEDIRNFLLNKTIVVTGAGGSIGSEIVRQLLRIVPEARIFFIDVSEYALYNLELSLTGKPLLTSDKYILADITNHRKMMQIFENVKPDIVFHAAAFKHVPLLERSPEAGILNNVLGTEIIAQMCARYSVSCLVNISTDKAARPTSILGLTKRLAEIRASNFATEKTKVSSVRFGNVLGSRGSFLEHLINQIMNGLPVTVTHPEMTRFFMTIPEAAGLVIQSAPMANGGSTYILDMGEPIKIVDLVTRCATLLQREIEEVQLTGIRPGEKLHEELFDPSEVYRETTHSRIRAVDATGEISEIQLRQLYTRAKECDPPAVLRHSLETLIGNNETSLKEA